MFCFTLQNELIAEHLVRRVSVMSGSLKQAEEVGAGDDTSFFFFLFFFHFSSLCYVIYFVCINFYQNYFIIILFIYFFHENYFYFFMFRDVPECSGMFRVPGFIDAHSKHEN